jgi:hypothetical protein
VAVRVEEEVTGLDVAVEEVSRVHVLERLEQLIYDIFLVNLLENVGAYHGVEIRFCGHKRRVNQMITLVKSHHSTHP